MRKNGHKQIKTIKDLAPDVLNANKGTPRGLQMVEDSLRTYGAGRSILVDKKGSVIAGNKTLQSASDIDLPIRVVETDGKELVVVQRTDLDLKDKKARELGIADNRSSQVGLEWDADILSQLKDEGVELSGMFTEKELAQLLPQGESKDAEPQIDKAAELQQKWQVATGEIIQIGRHRLMCGDSAKSEDVDCLMRGGKADVLFTDPPYGIERDEGFEGFGGFGTSIARRQYKGGWDSERPSKEAFDLILEFSKTAIIFGGNYFADLLPQSKHWIVWDKLNTMPTFGDCELAWTSVTRTSVKKYTVEYNGLIGKEKKRFHATQKPVALFQAVLGDYSKPESTVLDPFAGSGTTLVAAENLNRTCYAMEISPEYCAVTLERMTTAFPHLKIQREAISRAA